MLDIQVVILDDVTTSELHPWPLAVGELASGQRITKSILTNCAKEGTADGVVAFDISNPAVILIQTDDLFHTPSKESSQNEEVTQYSNCVLENGSLHGRLRF